MHDAHRSPQVVRNIWFSTGVLLVSAVTIFPYADDLSMWFDELWFVFMNNRGAGHILKEHDLNWPPGYTMLLHGWTSLISSHDFVIHMLGALIGVLGVAFMILAGRSLFDRRAGWLAGLAFGTSSYVIYFMLEARGYGLQLMLSAALVAFHARWTKKPTWRRAAPYTIVQILALYVQFTSGVVVALTAVRVLFVVPRREWWRWIVIMAVTGVAFLPLFPQFLESYQMRSDAFAQADLPDYFLKGPESIIQAYSAHQDSWWGLVLLLAGIGLCFWVRTQLRFHGATVGWLLLWGIGFPVYAYLTRESQGLFTTRYLVFTVPAIMLLIGIGLAALPRESWLLGGLVLLYAVVLPWQPFDHRPRYTDAPPVRDLMREMSKRLKTGDTVVIDPSIDSADYAWWYYEPLYIPGGRLPLATDGYTAGPRVWYLVRQGSGDAALQQSVETGRIAGEFWGPWYFIVRLYEGPVLTPGYRLGETITFRGHTLPDGDRYMPGDTIPIETWWSVEESPPVDYSIGIQLVRADGQIIAQLDSGPLGPDTPAQTSAWQPGAVYRDIRQITLPWCQQPGEYQVVLVVYQWWDSQRLQPADDAPLGPDNSVLLDTIQIDSFSYCD